MLKRYAMCGGGARRRPNGVENRRGSGRVGSETTRPPSALTEAVEFPDRNGFNRWKGVWPGCRGWRQVNSSSCSRPGGRSSGVRSGQISEEGYLSGVLLRENHPCAMTDGQGRRVRPDRRQNGGIRRT